MARLLIVEDNQELASLMVATAQSRGHEARAVHTGEDALGLISPGAFDAVVVDLLLSDMRGSQVLDALRPHAIPAIAVSGVFKGEPFAREAMDIHGARAFFEKPFELTTVLETAERFCADAGVAEPPPAVRLDPEEEAILDLVDLLVVEDDPPPPLLPPLSIPEEGAPVPVPTVSQEEAALTLALPFAQRENVWAKTADAPAAAPRAGRRSLPEWTLEGTIKEGTVPRLLNAYYEARHHGELKLKQGTVLKVVYFESGRVVYAASNLANERFARFCIRRGVVPESAVPELTRLTKEGLRTGEALLQLGLITAEQRRQLIEEQVKELIGSTFGWSDGAYGFSSMRPKRSDQVKLSVFPGDIVLEGIMRTETLVTLRQRLPSTRRLFPTADPPYGLHELKLSGAQALLLAYADGSKTVEDLLALTDLPVREALATLRGFELLGVLEERPEEPTRSRISFGL
ncbi:response regulator [Myxococcaceae bacterium GXIMD 01537]